MRRKQKKNTEPKLLIDQIIDRMFSGRGCREVTSAELQAAEQELIDKGLLSADEDPLEIFYEFHNRIGWPEGFWPKEQEIHE